MASTHRAPLVRGLFAADPGAAVFAADVMALGRRYAEVVARHRLCPFLKDVESGWGTFVVVLSPEPSVDEAVAIATELEAGVSHLVYPLVTTEPREWERFGNALGAALKARSRDAPALAAFHPRMAGDRENAHKLIGLMRQSPDPFVQLVPPDLTEGGTVLVTDVKGWEDVPKVPVDHAEQTYRRLAAGGGMDQLLAELAELRQERASWKPFRG